MPSGILQCLLGERKRHLKARLFGTILKRSDFQFVICVPGTTVAR